MRQTRCWCTADLSPAQYIQSNIWFEIICDPYWSGKWCKAYRKGVAVRIFSLHMGEKRANNFSKLGAWGLGRQIFMSEPSHSLPKQVIVITIIHISLYVQYIHLCVVHVPDCLFSLQVKNKPHSETAFLSLFLELAWSQRVTTNVN